MISIPVTYIIIGVTVAVSLWCFNNGKLKYQLTFSPYTCRHHNRWYNAFTHGFVHADYIHLFFNMFVLYSFGFQSGGQRYIDTGLESDFVSFFGGAGKLWYLLLYLGGILFATLPAFYKHSDNPNYLAVGASGAVSSVLFAFIILHPIVEGGGIRLLFIPIDIPPIVFGILYLAYEWYMGKRGKGNIAHDAHFSGAIFGILFTIALRPKTVIELVDTVSSVFS